MRSIKNHLYLFISFLFVQSSGLAANEWRVLLDAELSQWNTYLAVPGKHSTLVDWPKDAEGNYLHALGHNNDPLNVFKTHETDEGVLLHVSGEVYGGIYTKESFKNYHLQVQVKWGERKWPPRLDLELDSGILYHANGEHGIDYWKAWPLSQEFQIIEGGMGDYWNIANSVIDIACELPTKKEAEKGANPIYRQGSKFIEFGSGSVNGNHCRRAQDKEIPDKRWNTLDLFVFEDKSVHVVNGEVVMALRNSRVREQNGKEQPLTSGQILLQSEAGEVWFKDIKIRKLQDLPAEFKSHF